MMSYWTFSDVFEEGGVVKTPFYGGFGLLAEDSLPKPSFNAFLLLHRLGDTRLSVNSNDALVTRRADGSLVIAVWNLSLPEEKGVEREFALQFKGLTGAHHATVSLLDADHGSLLQAYAAMGSPANPTPAQIRSLRSAAELPPPQSLLVRGGRLELTLAPKALALIEIH
jgi:xylan 1,4-beta-xylosidase